MAKLTGSVGFGDYTDGELEFEMDADDARPQYIPAVTRSEKRVNEETGQEEDHEVVVTPAREESEDEAVARVLAQAIYVSDVQRSGLTSLSFRVEYTIRGEVELEFEEYDLDQEPDFEGRTPDEVDSLLIERVFADAIEEAIKEDLGPWGSAEREEQYVTDIEAQ